MFRTLVDVFHIVHKPFMEIFSQNYPAVTVLGILNQIAPLHHHQVSHGQQESAPELAPSVFVFAYMGRTRGSGFAHSNVVKVN